MATELRKDAELNRQRILQAARSGFAERGLAIGLDEIARLAGVGVGTVYRRFPNKDMLIDALFAERIDEVAALAQAALAEPDPWGGLRMFLESAVALFASDRGLREVVLGATHTNERVMRGREQLDPLVRAMISRAQADGSLRQDLQSTDFPPILIMLDTVADTAREVAPEIWRRMLELVLDGLRAQRQTASPLRVPPLSQEKSEELLEAWRP